MVCMKRTTSKLEAVDPRKNRGKKMDKKNLKLPMGTIRRLL